MGLLKMNPEIDAYWRLMNKYRNAASMVGKRYILEIEMAKLLLDAEQPRVRKLLEEFMEAERTKHGN